MARWLKFNWMYFRWPLWEPGVSPRELLALIVLSLLLAGCIGQPGLLAASATVSPAPATLIPSPVVTVTPTAYKGLCAYVWANQPLVEESIALGQAVRAAGFTQVESRAAAYGENCVDMGSNAIVQFIPRQTDFFFDIAVSDATNAQAMGEWVLPLFDILKEFPPGVVPGVNPGGVEMFFQDGARTAVISFSLSRGRELISQGLRGSALYEALLREE